MKKIISLAMAASLMALTLSACGSINSKVSATNNEASLDDATVTDSASTDNSSEKNSESSEKKLKIVTTIFPEYDWVNEILGDKKDSADVYMLLDNGVDLHSYQPTAKDIANIADCDLFIYVGGESDEWVDDALKEKINDNMVVINLLDTLGNSVKEEEIVEGMEGEEEEEAENTDVSEKKAEGDEEIISKENTENNEEKSSSEAPEGEEEEGPEYDEHVWLSLKNTKVICESIEAALETVDPANAELYRSNTDAYEQKLDDLDAKYTDAIAAAGTKTVLFGDRFPFRYLTDDYGLDYYAAFVGCSAETEASFETIAFLAGKVDELGLSTVLTIEGDNHKIAETIVNNTASKDQQILTMDSMQSTTGADAANGTTYLSVMESNLEVLKTALK